MLDYAAPYVRSHILAYLITSELTGLLLIRVVLALEMRIPFKQGL
jgi:hypothetical protein